MVVNVAGTGFLSRRTAEQIWCRRSLVLSSSFHLPRRTMRTQRGKFPNLPEKLSDGMDEKLMWVINIVATNAPDTLMDKVQGEIYCSRGKWVLLGEERKDARVGHPLVAPRHSQGWGSWILKKCCYLVMLLM